MINSLFPGRHNLQSKTASSFKATKSLAFRRVGYNVRNGWRQYATGDLRLYKARLVFPSGKKLLITGCAQASIT